MMIGGSRSRPTRSRASAVDCAAPSACRNSRRTLHSCLSRMRRDAVELHLQYSYAANTVRVALMCIALAAL